MRARKLATFVVLTVLISVLFSAANVTAGRKVIGLDGQVRSLDFSKAVPAQLNYQGYLVDAADSSAVTASLEMTFRLFDSQTKGAELWSETHTAVEVSNGLFQTLLGSVTTFPDGLFDGSSMWLQTEVGAEVLAPRKPLVSVAYSQKAVNADLAATAEVAGDAEHLEGQTISNLDDRWVNEENLDHLDAADGNPVNAVYVDATGKVGIGTTSPLTELDVNGSVNATTYFGDGSNLTGIPVLSDGDWTISGSDVYSAVSGNVGIGTSAPTEKLHVVGSSGNYGHMGSSNYGVYGYSAQPPKFKPDLPTNYDGVRGEGSGPAANGVYGHHLDSGNSGYLGGDMQAVYGYHSSSGNYGYIGSDNHGVFGVYGAAVGGESSAGVVGSSTNNAGVIGYSTNNSGIIGYGAGSTVPAVAGYHSGDGPAIYGSCSGGHPCVEGLRSDNGIAVAGFSNDGYGLYGHANSTDGIGVVGAQTDHNWSDISSYGFDKPGGLFGGRNGLIGFTTTENGYAVLGIATQDGSQTWAGRFVSEGHGVFITVPMGHNGITVNGFKSAVVRTDAGSRLFYCEESTEVWFSDHGFGQLQNGGAVVHIDPIFAQAVSLNEPYHVFIQAYGDADVYVTDRTADHFKVYLRDGNPNVEFSYRIMAKRAGYEGTRLERAPWADNDPYLYPEKRYRQGQGE